MPRRIRVVPSRGSGVVGAVVGAVLLIFAVSAGAPTFFFLAVLGIIGISLYNAFGRGIAESEIEIPDDLVPGGQATFCPQCGAAAGTGDQFCRGCGHRLTA